MASTSTLTILTSSQVDTYLAGLNISSGSEAYRTLNSMLLLPSATFQTAISAIAQGLITFADVRALPAINQRLVESLIAGRLGSSDATTLSWKYQQEWLPASIDLGALRTAAIGSITTAIAARFVDRWGSIIRPSYDFLKPIS